MSIQLFRQLGWFVVLVLVQVLVLNHIHLFGIAVPLLYIYFPITLRRNTPHWAALLWCFTLGLTIDVFSNTPGLAAGSLTLIGLLQPFWLELFVPRDSVEDMEVSAVTIGWGKYIVYASVLTVLFCLVFFALEAFNFFNWLRWLEYAGASTALTMVLIVAIESVRGR